jgi:hypothetical protein
MPVVVLGRSEHGPSARSSIPVIEQITGISKSYVSRFHS